MNTNQTEREKILNLLQQNQAIFKQFSVPKLAVFGSIVREESTEHSDVDVLVNFAKIPTSKNYFSLQFYLKDLLEKSIDLVPDKSLRKELHPYIEKELIYVS
jgi:uncharacterized protein